MATFQDTLLAQLNASSQAKKAELDRKHAEQRAAALRATQRAEAAEKERVREEASRFFSRGAGGRAASLFNSKSRPSPTSGIAKKRKAAARRNNRRRGSSGDNDDDDGAVIDDDISKVRRRPDREAMRRKREGGIPSKPLPGMEFVVHKSKISRAKHSDDEDDNREKRKSMMGTSKVGGGGGAQSGTVAEADYSDLFGPSPFKKLGKIDMHSNSSSDKNKNKNNNNGSNATTNNKLDSNNNNFSTPSWKDIQQSTNKDRDNNDYGNNRPPSTKGDHDRDLDVRLKQKEEARRKLQEATAQLERDKKNGKLSDPKRNRKRRLDTANSDWVAVDVPVPMTKHGDKELLSKAGGAADSKGKSLASRIADDAKRKQELQARKEALAKSFGAGSFAAGSSSKNVKGRERRDRDDDIYSDSEDDRSDYMKKRRMSKGSDEAPAKRPTSVPRRGAIFDSEDERDKARGRARDRDDARLKRKRDQSFDKPASSRYNERDRSRDRDRDRDLDRTRKKKVSGRNALSESDSDDSEYERRRPSSSNARRRDKDGDRDRGAGARKSNKEKLARTYYRSVCSDEENFGESSNDRYSDDEHGRGRSRGGGGGGLPRFNDLEEMEEEELESTRMAKLEDRIELRKEQQRKIEKERRRRALEGSDSDEDSD